MKSCRKVKITLISLRIFSSGWLSPAIHAMELCQMLTQAMYVTDPYLKQLPHVTKDLLERCQERKIESVHDLLEVEDDVRMDILKMSGKDLEDVARFCNNYPSIELEHEVEPKTATAGKPVTVKVSQGAERSEVGLGSVIEEGEIVVFFVKHVAKMS